MIIEITRYGIIDVAIVDSKDVINKKYLTLCSVAPKPNNKSICSSLLTNKKCVDKKATKNDKQTIKKTKDIKNGLVAIFL